MGTESFGRCNGVTGVTLDNICHHGQVLRIGKLGNGVHPTVGEMVPDSVLIVDKTAGLSVESWHARSYNRSCTPFGRRRHGHGRVVLLT